VRHFSIRTEDAYVQWVKRFILFHGKRHPAEVAAFLTHLAVQWAGGAGDAEPGTQCFGLSVSQRFGASSR